MSQTAAADGRQTARVKVILLSMPFFVLLFTRGGIEISVRLLPLRYSWIPAIAFYYLSIGACLLYSRRRLGLHIDYGTLSRRSFPKLRLFVFGIAFPAIIPLWVFVKNVGVVPPEFVFYIVLFSLINPFFEESFWRGLLDKIDAGRTFRIFYSALLFSFSHYFLWGAYWLLPPQKWIAAVVSTFIMGTLWMWFYQRHRNLLYPILSHVLVDIFNLSVAMFFGLKLVTV